MWLDALPDFHTLYTTTSANLNGVPVAYFTGQAGFDGFPEVLDPVKPENICMTATSSPLSILSNSTHSWMIAAARRCCWQIYR